ncbi:hypothetical protein [Saliterribacillus persicus]|uniref:Uncharacterized protein n=1 Tax=Saliterribacillus persicus TaxID=930114 RepID=A0A368XPB2_9BACI|nr:hypothetical protein [Saliterribacillus persicus]RCW69695.1 hypothetical protein DFR57_10783 [Saliterribacillus persicus]
MDKLTEELLIAQENVKTHQRLEREKNLMQHELADLRKKLADTQTKLKVEKDDVEKLESMSLANFFQTVIGKKDEKLLEEKQDVARVQLVFEQTSNAITGLEKESDMLEIRISQVRNAASNYEKLKQEKFDLLLAENHPQKTDILATIDQIGQLESEKKEIEEALTAGSKVSAALSRAENALDKAKNWGTVDMFGGGLLTTSIKHSHMDDAKADVQEAQHLLRKFSFELDDIGHAFDTDISISGGLTFADYFFDGLISDWFVQDKIHQSLEEVTSMNEKVRSTCDELAHLFDEVTTLEDDAIKVLEKLIIAAK